MSFKKSFFQHSISPLQLKLLAILDDWGRSDGSFIQIVNEIRRRKFFSRMPPKERLFSELLKLIEVELVKKVEYMDGTIHYILREYFYE